MSDYQTVDSELESLEIVVDVTVILLQCALLHP